MLPPMQVTMRLRTHLRTCSASQGHPHLHQGVAGVVVEAVAGVVSDSLEAMYLRDQSSHYYK